MRKREYGKRKLTRQDWKKEEVLLPARSPSVHSSSLSLSLFIFLCSCLSSFCSLLSREASRPRRRGVDAVAAVADLRRRLSCRSGFPPAISARRRTSRERIQERQIRESCVFGKRERERKIKTERREGGEEGEEGKGGNKWLSML